MSAIRQTTHVAVVISDRQRRNQTPARRFKRASVTDRLSGWDPLEQTYSRMQRHHRQQLASIARRRRQNIAPEAIQHAAWPHHVSPRLAMPEDACLIRHVLMRLAIAVVAK